MRLKKRIVVASMNPVKVQAAVDGFRMLFPETDFEAIPISVPSGVDEQPMTDEETLQGALNRVENARIDVPAADYWIGIEGGVCKLGPDLAAFAWIVIRTDEMIGKARSGTFFLPHKVKELVESGVELGVADDQVFGHTNSKQKGGAVGLLTGNAVNRQALYRQAVALALVPFKNEELYLSS